MTLKVSIRIPILILLSCLLTQSQTADTRSNSAFFPDGVFGDVQQGGDIRAKWYARILTALGEKSLLGEAATEKDAHIYRFAWIRTFDNPVSVRLTIETSGEGVATTKISDGHGGYGTGKLILDNSTRISKEKIQTFISRLQEVPFWSMPSENDASDAVDSGGYRLKVGGLDGARWILEGVKDGQYHVVDRWSPEFRGPKAAGSQEYGQLCRYLLTLGKVKVEEKKLY